jgi:hypothetical protein
MPLRYYSCGNPEITKCTADSSYRLRYSEKSEGNEWRIELIKELRLGSGF